MWDRSEHDRLAQERLPGSPFAEWLQSQACEPMLAGHAPAPRPICSELRPAGRAGSQIIRVEQKPGRYVQDAGDECTLQLVRLGEGISAIHHGASAFQSPVVRGGLALSPPNERLIYDARGGGEYLILALPGDLIRSTLEPVFGSWRDFAGLHQKIFYDIRLQRLVSSIWEEVAQNSPHGRLFADGAIVSVLAILATLAQDRSLSPAFRWGLTPRQVQRVTAFIREHLHEDISLSDMAATVDLSPYHFCRAFKQSTGRTPHGWLTEKRIERARALMQDRKCSLIEVALSVGYSSQGAFGAAFRRHMGVTPHHWRREHAS